MEYEQNLSHLLGGLESKNEIYEDIGKKPLTIRSGISLLFKMPISLQSKLKTLAVIRRSLIRLVTYRDIYTTGYQIVGPMTIISFSLLKISNIGPLLYKYGCTSVINRLYDNGDTRSSFSYSLRGLMMFIDQRLGQFLCGELVHTLNHCIEMCFYCKDME